MALPVVSSVHDCANYANTLEPYLYQLRPLPYLAWEHLSSPAALQQLYVDTNPFITGLAFSLFLSPFFLLAANVNQNWSQIDRVWSILPTLYNVHWALWTHLSGLPSQRMDLRLLVSLVWSIRLTFNYWRRGGYKIGSEDYRWELIQNAIGKPAFFILDVFFISSIQNVLLFMVTSPSYVSLLVSRLDAATGTTPLTAVDYTLAGTIVWLIAQTMVADQQQWTFQNAKHTYRETAKVPANCGYTAEELDRGFGTKGLWAYSRHPNFISEQLVWWSFYLWSSILAGSLFNWTAIGPGIYSLVFAGSTPITEYISSGKYPKYKQYQKQVGMFLPKSFSTPTFSGESSPQKKRIANGELSQKAAEDYAQAKKRYDLR